MWCKLFFRLGNVLIRFFVKTFIALIVVSILYAVLIGLFRDFNWNGCVATQEKFLSLGFWAPLLILGGFALSSVALVPGTPLALFTGLIFGIGWGTLLALTGANMGASLAYAFSRTFGRRHVEKFLANRAWFRRMQDQLQGSGFEFMLFVRLVPIFPFTGLNFACGLLPIRTRDFILGSWIGMLPGTLVYVSLGHTGCQMIEQITAPNFRVRNLPADLQWQLLVIGLVLIIMGILPLIWKSMKQRSK